MRAAGAPGLPGRGRADMLTVAVWGMSMSSVEAITAAIARLPPEHVREVRAWRDEQAERAWDDQIQADERAGRLDAPIARAKAARLAGRTRGYRSETSGVPSDVVGS